MGNNAEHTKVKNRTSIPNTFNDKNNKDLICKLNECFIYVSNPTATNFWFQSWLIAHSNINIATSRRGILPVISGINCPSTAFNSFPTLQK